MKETTFNGYRVIQVQNNQLHDKSDSLGFDHPVVYTVRDDFDESVLPPPVYNFWTPHEACGAIQLAATIGKHLLGNPKWPTTMIFEYNRFLQYRRNWGAVMSALIEIETMCSEAIDFGEDATKDVLKRLQKLQGAIYSTP